VPANVRIAIPNNFPKRTGCSHVSRRKRR
jgi:hypothetical protein